jgi:hypothetical protein
MTVTTYDSIKKPSSSSSPHQVIIFNHLDYFSARKARKDLTV